MGGTTSSDLATSALAARLRLAVNRLARRLRQEAVSGVTSSMMSALSSLDRQGPLTLGDLAAVEQVQPPTMTRIVSALEEADLLRRRTDRRDRRVSRVEITSRGKRLLEDSRTRKDAHLAASFAALSTDEMEALLEALPVLERLIDMDFVPDDDER